MKLTLRAKTLGSEFPKKTICSWVELIDVFLPSDKWYTTSMAKESAGLLMFRVQAGRLEVLLAHPGGPFWKNKDAGAWTIPKGELAPGEDALSAAEREFREETGLQPSPPFIPLGKITQKSGKIVHAWAFQGNCVPGELRSNLIEIEWPPKSGTFIQIPEVDRHDYFPVFLAKEKVNPAQFPLLQALESFFPVEFGRSSKEEDGRQGSFGF